MEFRNFTPFPPLHFESRDEKKNDFGVVVTRATFALEPDALPRLVQKQEAIVLADEYIGEPGQSSIKIENNIAPYKPKSDIHIFATAHAPEGKPCKEWNIGVKIGDKINKQIHVTGPRYWSHRGEKGWQLTDITPAVQVPIRYEHAFGGSEFAENPLGTGFVHPEHVDPEKPIVAPQILPIDQPPLEFGKPIKAEGLGALSPSWKARSEHAGTFDLVWEKTRWPDLPEDFKFAFYNSAHPDLIYPEFLEGDETIELTHLTPVSPFRFQLPGFVLALLIRWEDGQIAPAPMRLDTVHIDMEAMQLFLTWRGVFPLAKPIRALELRMQVPDAYRAPSDEPEATKPNGQEPPLLGE